MSNPETPMKKLARMIEAGERLSIIARTRYSRWGRVVCWFRMSHVIPGVTGNGFYSGCCERCGKLCSGIFFKRSTR